MRSRSRLEIYLALIDQVSKHINPTSIAKEVNLSLADTEKHLSFLASQGFLRIAEREKSGVEYELTSKGYEAVEALRRITQPEHLSAKQR